MEGAIGLLYKGYDYFNTLFRKRKTNLLKQRLFFKKVIVMRGEEASSVFYDQTKFKRAGATPKRFQKTLFGQGGVQGLDGSSHLKRKALFMRFMNPESIKKLEADFRTKWLEEIPKWENLERIQLFQEAEKILMRAACAWVGVPLHCVEVELRTSQMSKMIDASGAVGLRHYKGRRARKKAEKWIEEMVLELRENKNSEEKDSIFHAFAVYQDENGKFLDKKTVAVEILNLLRPIVAIARYITFTALALHKHPDYKKRIKKEPDLDHYFVLEVRRFYPFFPFVAARVKEEFAWKNVIFSKGTRVLLDLYATNHDENQWDKPDVFFPERFKNWDGSAFNYIPQGGGDHNHNHRCAGEWITINLTQAALNILVCEMNYQVPVQDLTIKKNRIPAIPKSRLLLERITKTTGSA